MHAGAVPSTIYKQLKSGQIEYISNLLEAKVAFVGDAELFEEANKARENCPDKKYIIMIEDFEQYKDLDYVLSYEDLINKGKEINSNDKSELENRINSVKSDSLACLIFTSGTTGNQKELC